MKAKNRNIEIDSLKEEIISQYVTGRSADKIAKKFNCNRQTIVNRLTEWNVPLRPKGFIRYHPDRYDKNSIPQVPPCVQCGRPIKPTWSDKNNNGNRPCWHVRTICHRCYNIKTQHGWSFSQYDEYFSKGCSVENCNKKPIAVDHDHSICSRKHHSCVKCRRGVLCRYHNVSVIAIIDKLRSGELNAELSYLKVSVEFKEAGS